MTYPNIKKLENEYILLKSWYLFLSKMQHLTTTYWGRDTSFTSFIYLLPAMNPVATAPNSRKYNWRKTHFGFNLHDVFRRNSRTDCTVIQVWTLKTQSKDPGHVKTICKLDRRLGDDSEQKEGQYSCLITTSTKKGPITVLNWSRNRWVYLNMDLS